MRVVQDKAAHYEQPQVQLRLEEQSRAEEDVRERQNDQSREESHQSASQIQPRAALTQKGTDGERDEYERCTD